MQMQLEVNMTKFVSIGKYFINLEHVLTVTAPDANDPAPDANDRIWIELDSGQTIEAEGKYFSRVIGMKSDISKEE